MLTGLLLLLAAAPGPRGPADFDQAIYLPRLDKATLFTEFLKVGGERSVLLRSENWREAVHPLLRFDITRPETAAGVGIDESAPMTLIIRGDLEVSCVNIKHPERFHAACADRLKTVGTPYKATEAGATLYASRDTLDRVLLGYAVKGNESCAVRMQGRNVDGVLKEVARWLGKPAAGTPWKWVSGTPGAGFVLTRKAALSLTAEGLTASATARGELPMLAGLAGPGPSPYATFSSAGLLSLKVRSDPSAVPAQLDLIASRLLSICPSCEAGPFKQAAAQLGRTLTGNALLVVERIKVTGSLRTDAGRFFAVRLAAFAETHSPDEALKALMLLTTVKGAKPLDSGEGVSLLLKEGEVRLGVRGRHVFAANDPSVLESSFKALPETVAAQAHGAEFQVNPKLVAQGLGQVPLMDAIGSAELAGALAAGAELGPLLLATEKIGGFADAPKAFVSWTLKPLPQRPDAGSTTDGGPPLDAGPR